MSQECVPGILRNSTQNPWGIFKNSSGFCGPESVVECQRYSCSFAKSGSSWVGSMVKARIYSGKKKVLPSDQDPLKGAARGGSGDLL